MRLVLKRCALLMAVLLMTALAGCGKSAQAGQPDPEKGIYAVYYLNSGSMGLSAELRQVPEGSSGEELVACLLGELFDNPERQDHMPVFAGQIRLNNAALNNQVLEIDFDKNYLAMDRNREILCRAALAKTMTQIPDVAYVTVSCDGQPLQDSAGNPVGAFTGNDFVDSISDVNSFERVTLKLYFASQDGTVLVPEERQVVHRMSTSMEKLVVEQLLEGSRTGNLPVLPRGTQILNVSITDGICYVNLDDTFLSGEITVQDSIPVYALVDSLTELKSVSRVQLMVNGSAEVMFHSVSLAEPLDRNEGLVAGGQTP